MCDGNAIGTFLLLAELAVIAASAMLLIAIEKGQSIFTAFDSMGLSATTLVFVGMAIASLVVAAGLVSSGCTGGGCGGSGAALLTAINVTIGMLTGLTIALAVATFVPGAAAIAGPAALITLGGAGGSFAYLGAMAAALATCLSAAATTPPFMLGISAGFAYVAAASAVITAVYGAIVTIRTAAASASG